MLWIVVKFSTWYGLVQYVLCKFGVDFEFAVQQMCNKSKHMELDFGGIAAESVTLRLQYSRMK